jgi:hypothetical protein
LDALKPVASFREANPEGVPHPVGK